MRAVLLIALLITGCAAPPPAVTQAAPPAPPPSPAHSVEPSPDPAAAPNPPPIGPVADTEALAIARSVCPAAVKHDEDRVRRVGCRACPPFGPSAAPDGKVVSDPETFYPIEGVYPGSFTAPGADQRAVVFEGCEPHADNYGGTLLVDAVGPGAFKVAGYYSGVHPESCRPYRRPDGRDLLVCTWSDVHQGSGYEQLFAFDFTVATPGDRGPKGWTELVTVHRNAFAACYGIPPESGLRQGRIIAFRFEDHPGERAPRIVVELEHRLTPFSRPLGQAVKEQCQEAEAAGREPVIDAPRLLGAPRKETVEFVFDGHELVPTARSRAVLRAL
jgi:hypothetical protein